MRLYVNLGEDSYPIYIENHILDNVLQYIKEVFQGKRIIIVSDDNVFPLYGEKILNQLNEQYDCHQTKMLQNEQL